MHDLSFSTLPEDGGVRRLRPSAKVCALHPERPLRKHNGGDSLYTGAERRIIRMRHKNKIVPIVICTMPVSRVCAPRHTLKFVILKSTNSLKYFAAVLLLKCDKLHSNRCKKNYYVSRKIQCDKIEVNIYLGMRIRSDPIEYETLAILKERKPC